MIWVGPIVITAVLTVLALASIGLRRKYPPNDTPLIDAIDQLLPQTQCAQCGYPGCHPYAQAVANGAPTNLCPPGGSDTHQALDELMGISSEPPSQPAGLLAVIDEANCIGCTLCLPPCPVDAIVGGQGYMHSVITNECTGCELCVPACPVDCISMTTIGSTEQEMAIREPSGSRACINCGLCIPVCPVDLDPQALFKVLARADRTGVATHELETCIECGLCDRVCPSEIELSSHFAVAKIAVQRDRASNDARNHFKARFEKHQARQAHAHKTTSSRRDERLQRKSPWTQPE